VVANSILSFQNEFPNATMWYTGGSHTLLPATPEPITKAGLAETLQAAANNPAVREDLGGPEQISRYLIIEAEQFRQFAGEGEVVQKNNAFFLPINAEMSELIRVIQLAAIRANP
jgi:hypothetical protein